MTVDRLEVRVLLSTVGLLLASPAHAQHAPDAVIDPALTADVSPAGLEQLITAAGDLIPTGIKLDDLQDGKGDCDYSYALSNAEVGLDIVGAQITPHAGSPGYVGIELELDVWLNSEANPASLEFKALDCFIDEQCTMWVEPFPVTVTGLELFLEMVEGKDGKYLDATIVGLDEKSVADNIDIGLVSEKHINVEDCAIGYLEDILNFFGLSLFDLVIDLFLPELLGQLSDFGPELETTIEALFVDIDIEEQLELQEALYDLALSPSDVVITDGGIRLAFAGQFSAVDVAECIVDLDPGSSLATPSDPPDVATGPAEIASDFHLVANVADDFVNQALYSVWRGGLLCMTIDEELFALDTGLLGVLAQQSFEELFPESVPAHIEMLPKSAPTTDLAGAHDLSIDVQDLGLGIFAELDGRQAMLFEVDLDLLAGVDLELDPKTGELGAVLDLGTDDMVVTMAENELMPEAKDEITTNFKSLFGTLAEGLIGGLAEDLSFALPAYEGLGLTDIAVAANGDEADWLGVFAWVGPVTYKSAGCGEDKKGKDSSCGGCATRRFNARWYPPMALTLLLVGLRRRDRRPT